jgi:hypothetical protein
MNSTGAEPGIESELIDLDGVPFTKLRELTGEALNRSMSGVLERTQRVRARYRSGQGGGGGGGERVD